MLELGALNIVHPTMLYYCYCHNLPTPLFRKLRHSKGTMLALVYLDLSPRLLRTMLAASSILNWLQRLIKSLAPHW